MRGKVAKDLRRLAHQKWIALKAEYREAISQRKLYQQLKKEFYDEKR